MRIKTASSLVAAAAAVLMGNLSAVSMLRAGVTPKAAEAGSVPTAVIPAANTLLTVLNPSLVKREQRLSRLTFEWQIKDEESSPSQPTYSYASTQLWKIARAGAETLVTGTKEQGTYLGDFVQYYNGSSGIIVCTRNDFNGVSLAPVPPLVWGSTGDSIRFREPFQTGFNLMPEHFALLTGLNPLALYDTHWQVTATTPLTWTLEATVSQGSDTRPTSVETVELTLSRRLSGAPAKIVVRQGNETWTYLALGYRHQGKDWICDKFSLDFEYPGIQQRKQTWTLETVKPTMPLPPLPTSNKTSQMVSDYRRVGLNLTTEQYLDAISQQPSKVVMYAWPGHFPAINELDTIKFH